MLKKQKNRESQIYKTRHSLSHILAQAVQKIRPGTKLGFGPPIDNGFYYDFILPEPISEDDFPELEKLIKDIIKEGQKFTREDLPAKDAISRLQKMQEPHKIEYAKELIEKNNLSSLSFYTNGPFVDMCEGPHMSNTGDIPLDCFKLDSIAGAYWRGDERNVMMSRIYTLAFLKRKDLEDYITKREIALQRDHRKLGKELEIFIIDDEVGKGLPLWLPNGTVIRQELEKLAHELEFKAGYKRVATPHITKDNLYRTSGHLPYYQDSMYPPMVLTEDVASESSKDEGTAGSRSRQELYYLKPMNCPHHHKIYASKKRSYRELPLRLAEYGAVYRYEKGGELQGLARVRGMTMNDAHIYCTKEQVKEEFKAVMALHKQIYDLFEFSDYYMRLSLGDREDQKGKYVDNPEAWIYTEKLTKEAMDELEIPYEIAIGEAAFYGPKVDIQFHTVIEREFTVSTNQLDFAIPPRFNLSYVDRDDTEQTPFVIHRAPLGTHERFIALLIEHYGGAFPTWLAPVQIRILPLSIKFLEYSKRLDNELRNLMIRSEVDESDETLSKKIRVGSINKIPILLIIGEKEQSDESVTVRRYGIKEQRTFKFRQFIDDVVGEINSRRHTKEW